MSKKSDQLMPEVLDYFANHSGFQRLFALFRKKYESLGRIGGTVSIGNFRVDEVEAVSRFFGMHPEELADKGSVSLLAFERKLKTTKFSELSLLSVLEAYFGERLISNKELRIQIEQQHSERISRFKQLYPNLIFWLDHILRRSADSHWIYRLLEEDDFSRQIALLSKAFSRLPATEERLPVFSQRIAGDPHALDLSATLGKLWIHLLHIHQNVHQKSHSHQGVPSQTQPHPHSPPPSDSESVNILLQQFRLLRDDITNDVTCANLLAETLDGSHPVWQAAADTCTVLNMPLRELLPLISAYPKHPSTKKVWIVENSGVFSSLLDAVPQVPMLCTHGQFKLAALKLMDLLTASQCELHYAGDFDPEGLSMAARLKQRYPQHVAMWRMNPRAYQQSQPAVALEADRLAKLESVTDPELKLVASQIKSTKKAGYQEALLHDMIADLRKQEFLP